MAERHLSDPAIRIDCLHDPPTLAGADGYPIAIGKPFAALVHLTLANRTVTRDELAHLLWPRVPREKALQSARQALSALRKHLGEILTESSDPVIIDRSGIIVDVDLLRTALDSGHVDDALEIWKAPFLHGFSIPGVPEWDQWVEEMRQSLSTRMARALTTHARKEREAGRTANALRYYRRCAEISPFELPHNVDLIETCMDSGQLDDAADALSHTRRHFPEPEYAAELERLTSRLHVLRREQPRPDTDPLSRPDLVGRSAELSQLLGAWHASREGDSSLVFIAGPAGIGKTRLVQELGDVALADRARTVYAKATEAERRLPWSVAVMLVRSLLDLPGAAGVTAASDRLLRALVPSHANGADDPNPVPLIGEARSAALTDAVVDLVSAVAYENPVLIAIDDLHWVDRDSLALLAHVAREARNHRALFVFTFRREDLPLESRSSIVGLESDQRARCMELRALSDAEVAELLSSTLSLGTDAPIDAIAQRIHAATSGNPFFITELLKAFAQDGIITRGPDGWCLDPRRLPVELPLPRSVQDLINRRLARLSTPATTIAAHLAELPSSAPVRLLRKQVDLSDGAFAKGLGELIDRDVVRWDGDEHLIFAHDQVRRAARKRLHGAFSAREQPISRRAMAVAGVAVLVIAILWFSGGATRLASVIVGAPSEERVARYLTFERDPRVGSAAVLGRGVPGYYKCGPTIVVKQRIVKVPARDRWTTMGIDVHAGCDIVEIDAVGMVAVATADSASPDGQPDILGQHPLAPAPYAAPYSLICRISGYQPFFVGSRATLPVSESGPLECGMNEGNTTNDVYADNSGFWTVRVRIRYNALTDGQARDSAAAKSNR